MDIRNGAVSKLLWLMVAATQPTFADTENPALRGQKLQLPNDVEQRASYCLAVSKLQHSALVSLANEAESTSRSITDPTARQAFDESQRTFKEEIDKSDDNINRLQLFLLPRTQYLQPTAMLSAYSRGKADFYKQQNSQIPKQCFDRCKNNDNPQVCNMACMEEDPLNRRIFQCRDLLFLPY